MIVNAILAHDKNYGIGFKDKLPWPKNEEDMLWFKNNTKNDIVIMGRKTWESLPVKPLPNRLNVIATRTTKKELGDYKKIFSQINKVENIAEWLGYFEEMFPDKKVWIIGGAEIYEKTIQYCDFIYVTEMNGIYESDKSIDPKLFKNFTEISSKIGIDGNTYKILKRNLDYKEI